MPKKYKSLQEENPKLALEWNYEKNGTIDQTSHAFSKEDQASHYALTGKVKDTKFEYPGNYAFIFDVPNVKYKKHTNITKAPGSLPKEYLVGVIHIKDSKKTLDKLLISVSIASLLISLVSFSRMTGNVTGGINQNSLGIFFIIISFITLGGFFVLRNIK